MELIKELFEISEESYKKFNENVVKGYSLIIGVRIPILRKIANLIIKEKKVDEFFLEYEGKYFEEKLIKGLIITNNEEIFKKYINDYLDELDSWCLVDTFCNSCKFMKNKLDEYWSFVIRLLNSKDEFIIRTGYVLMLNYYLNDEYIDKIVKLCKKQYSDYYVNMAIAWLLCDAYIKYPDKVFMLLKSKALNEFVHKKTIDKINDSFRISDIDKKKISELK